MNGWRPSSWVVKKDSQVMAEGEGTDTGAVLKSIASAPGTYRVEWLLENDTGLTAIAARDFTVKE
jgi:hypothetical protein